MASMRIDLQLLGAGVVSRDLRAVAADFREVAAAQREAANASRSLSRAVTGRTRTTQNITQAITQPLVPMSQAITAQPLTTNVTGAGGPTVVNAQQAASAAAVAQANAQAVASVQILATAAQQAAAALGAIQRAPVQGAGGGTGGARGSRAPSGPTARLATAQARLQQAQASGNQQQIFDARFNLAQAQRAMQRAQKVVNPPPPPGLGQRLLELIGTSRIGVGNGGMQISPLVNRLGQLVAGGGGSLAGGATGALAGGLITAGIAAAGVALKAFADVVRSSSETLQDFRRAVFASGATTQQVARLSALGVEPARMAAAAADFRQGALSDPTQARAARALGARPMHGSRGRQRETTDFLAALENLRAMGQSPKQMLLARQAGLSAYLPQLNVSPSLRRGQDDITALQQRGIRPADMQAAGDFQESLRQVGQSFQLLIAEIGKPFLKPLTEGFQVIAAVTRTVAQHMEMFHGVLVNIDNGPIQLVRGLGAFGKAVETFKQKVNTGPLAQAAARFQASLGNVGAALRPVFDAVGRVTQAFRNLWDKALARMSEPLINAAAMGLNKLASLFEQFPAYVNKFIEGYNKFSDVARVSTFGQLDFGKVNPIDLKKLNEATAQSSLDKSINRLITSVDQNTQVQREGLSGGAERAREAIRSGHRGEFLEKALEQRAMQWGAFSF